MSRKRVLVTSPDLNDSVSWWRQWRPWCELSQSVDDVDITGKNYLLKQIPQWSDIEAANVVAINRPFAPEHLMLVEMCADAGRPIIVEMDDMVWRLPTFNKASRWFTIEHAQIASECCRRATFVTTTTEYLKNYINEVVAPDSDVRVIPSCLPEWYTWNDLAFEKRVLWRGGDTHMADLFAIKDDVEAVAKAFPEWKWTFFGADPFYLNMEYESVNQMPLPKMHRWLRQNRFGAMIVPLIDCPFNRAKSHISWLEGSLCGARVIAPDFDEFRKPGVVTYGPGQLRERLEGILWLAEGNQRHVDESRKYIDENLRASQHATALNNLIRMVEDG